jgi:O-antigen/teichoic acid export membrane protein
MSWRNRAFLSSPSRRGLLAQLFSLSTILGVQVLQVPIFIHVLGPKTYGSYLILIALPSALTLSDFGLLSATSTRLMAFVATGDLKSARRLSRFTNSLVIGITSAILVIVAAVIWLVPLHADPIGPIDARLIIIQYCLYAVLSVFSSAFEGSMRAAGAYAGAWARLGVLRLVDFAAAVVALTITGSPVYAVSAMLMSRGAGLVWLRWRVHVVAPWASWRPLWPRAVMAPGLLRPTLGSLALPVGNALVNQGALIAVGASLGPVAVVTFTTVRTMVNVLRQLTGVVANSSLPKLTQDIATRSYASARANHKRSIGLTSVVSLIGAVAMSLMGPWIVSIWTSGQVVASHAFIALMSVQTLVESTWVILSIWFLAQNRHLSYSLVYLASATLFVSAVLVLRPSNLDFVAVLQIASSSIVLIWVAILLRKEKLDESTPIHF